MILYPWEEEYNQFQAAYDNLIRFTDRFNARYYGSVMGYKIIPEWMIYARRDADNYAVAIITK